MRDIDYKITAIEHEDDMMTVYLDLESDKDGTTARIEYDKEAKEIITAQHDYTVDYRCTDDEAYQLQDEFEFYLEVMQDDIIDEALEQQKVA